MTVITAARALSCFLYLLLHHVLECISVNYIWQDSDGTKSDSDRDTLGPLPTPPHPPPALPGAGWAPPGGPAYNPPAHPTFPAPTNLLGPIYNPAPPPSTYMPFAYSETGVAAATGVPGAPPAGTVQSSFMPSSAMSVPPPQTSTFLPPPQQQQQQQQQQGPRTNNHSHTSSDTQSGKV